MYCKVCGENLKPNAKFCENCGTKVKKETDAIPKTDIKKSTEPVKPKVKLEETKTSKKKIIVGVVVALAIVGMIFSPTSKGTTAIPKEHREFLAKIGLKVPADNQISFTDEMVNYIAIKFYIKMVSKGILLYLLIIKEPLIK